ncbi:hypothetical protein [Sphingomonas aerophila]|uniref:Uncharacterized protein n=1 Tax=Sphingomonas aerophila TaxID=1344948 RepID=A0A7W9BDX7_9SPHN|nr:hypothetical protein [Sphingomonas aerophila]MBB5715076.1 hypothetical protein [Sphingomonas aerophila]
MAGQDDRAERLKAQLRANLRRRKVPGDDPGEDATPSPDKDRAQPDA